jgi:hypothetical protein
MNNHFCAQMLVIELTGALLSKKTARTRSRKSAHIAQ